ncbi:unnamed protein product [Dicrocoelium dendriticum]|nr:unnamed protein product [Dicrocoelium dendriticum]
MTSGITNKLNPVFDQINMRQPSNHTHTLTPKGQLTNQSDHGGLPEGIQRRQPLRKESSESSATSVEQLATDDITEDSDHSLKEMIIGTSRGLRASQRRRRGRKRTVIAERYIGLDHDSVEHERPEYVPYSARSVNVGSLDDPGGTSKSYSSKPSKETADLENIAQYLHTNLRYWYLPDINLAEVYRRLRNQPTGSFIVCRNNDEPDSYKLYFKHPEGSIQCISIDQVYNHFILRGLPRYPGHTSLLQLIATHCRQVYILPCTLQIPSRRLFKMIGSPISTSMTNLLDTKRTGAANKESTFRNVAAFRLPKSSGSDLNARELLSGAVSGRTPVARRPTELGNGTRWHRSVSSLIPQGAACKLFYFGNCNVGNFTGSQVIKVCVDHLLDERIQTLNPIPIEFRVNENGITMTDFEQRFFTKRHIPATFLGYIGLDPLGRTWHAKALFSEAPTESR